MLFVVRHLARASVLACGVIVTACAQPNEPDSVEGEIAVERLAFEIYSGFEEADRRVIRNAIEWAMVWTSLNKSHDPQPPRPVINFSTEQIVVAALGARPSTGYSVRVTGASGTGNGVTVRLETQSPGPGCGVLTTVTYPVEISKMPRTAEPVSFEETRVVKNCG